MKLALKLSMISSPMDLIAEYRNTITQRYAKKILDKSGVQNRTFQNINKNVSEKQKIEKQTKPKDVTSHSRETRNRSANLTQPQKRYKS